MPTPDRGSAFLQTTLAALRTDDGWRAALDRLPVPIYTTDRNGAITYWNRACVGFAGRQPQLGQDRWCVTWQLYTTTGERLLHEDCPMAEAIKKEREVRGEVAIALRPDGSRRAFTPYPTPLFDEAGQLTGAVNLLIDVSEEQARALHEQAARCTRLSRELCSRADSALLADLAERYQTMSTALSGDEG